MKHATLILLIGLLAIGRGRQTDRKEKATLIGGRIE